MGRGGGGQGDDDQAAGGRGDGGQGTSGQGAGDADTRRVGAGSGTDGEARCDSGNMDAKKAAALVGARSNWGGESTGIGEHVGFVDDSAIDYRGFKMFYADFRSRVYSSNYSGHSQL